MLLKIELKMNLWKAEYIVLRLYVSPLLFLKNLILSVRSACTVRRSMLE